MRNIRNGEVLANFAKYSPSQIKVGLQYFPYSPNNFLYCFRITNELQFKLHIEWRRFYRSTFHEELDYRNTRILIKYSWSSVSLILLSWTPAIYQSDFKVPPTYSFLPSTSLIPSPRLKALRGKEKNDNSVQSLKHYILTNERWTNIKRTLCVNKRFVNKWWTQCEWWTENDLFICNVSDMPLYSSFSNDVRETIIFYSSE
jgi:hypothetical protein